MLKIRALRNGANSNEKLNYFLVKQKDKWGVVDAADKIVKPFVYDYAHNQIAKDNPFILVKNNQASTFDGTSIPNELDYFPHSSDMFGAVTPIGSYTLIDDEDGVFFINDTGRVVIPPQYKPLKNDFSKSFLLVEDAQKKKKLIFLTTGGVVDCPFDYQVHIANAKSRVIVVSDSTANSYGVVSTDGLQPMLILTNGKGELFVESGRYDGVSKFYGQYALVSAAGKVGLIDSFGREIIAPQDLRTYKQQFMDSLDIPNKEARKNALPEYQAYFVSQLPQPIVFNSGNKRYHPDSLGISPAQSAALWNLMLEKSLPWLVHTASDVAITRASQGAHVQYGRDNYTYGQAEQVNPSRIVVSNKTTAFAWIKEGYLGEPTLLFYNFYRKNDRWEDLDINDLLHIQGEKRWLINEVITRKVKALKDVQIDCSNAAAFITKAENQWMLTNEGIDFCFENQDGDAEFAVVSLTWAELSPFLKMKL